MSLRGQRVPACRYMLIFLLACAVLPLTGCSTFEGMFSSFSFGEEEAPEATGPEALIVEGMDAYEVGNYKAAIKAFNAILDEHPFSKQAMLAELKLADSHYYNMEYSEAKTYYKSFEEHYPTNEAIPYVMFQTGMCDFRRSDRIDRDISGPQDAIKSFTRLLRAYPDSPYSDEAKAKIQEAREFIVNHEYMVATFYVRVERYDEAKHRLKYLLSMYPDSSLSPQAKQLLQKLEEGKPPQWGMGRWLPKFMTTAPIDRGEETPVVDESGGMQVDTDNGQ